MVAKLISLHAAWGMKRQIFFVSVGNYDTHVNQLATQNDNLGALSKSLKAFYDATVELQVPAA